MDPSARVDAAHERAAIREPRDGVEVGDELQARLHGRQAFEGLAVLSRDGAAALLGVGDLDHRAAQRGVTAQLVREPEHEGEQQRERRAQNVSGRGTATSRRGAQLQRGGAKRHGEREGGVQLAIVALIQRCSLRGIVELQAIPPADDLGDGGTGDDIVDQPPCAYPLQRVCRARRASCQDDSVGCRISGERPKQQSVVGRGEV